MHIGKVLRLLGIAIASLALVMMTVSASSNSLSSSFALEDQKFTAKMTDKEEGAAGALTSNNSPGEDVSSDGTFRIDGQRLYNLAIHNNYTTHSIIIDVKGKGFQFYTFTFG